MSVDLPAGRPRQGARDLRRRRRPAAAGGLRPDLGLRPRAADADPGQGAGAHRSCRCGGSSSWRRCSTSFGASHHLISRDGRAGGGRPGRAMLVRRLEMLPVECVARGYLSGSGTVEYSRTGSIRDVALPAGLVEGSRLPAPVFTPSTKAEVGEHDEAIDFAAVVAAVGAARAEELRELTLALYSRAAEIALEARDHPGRHEVRVRPAPGGALVLGDEVLTPDSSRFWPAVDLVARVGAAVVRQAVRARLADVVRLGPRLAAAGAAGRRRRRHPRALRHRLRAAHRHGRSPDGALARGPRRHRGDFAGGHAATRCCCSCTVPRARPRPIRARRARSPLVRRARRAGRTGSRRARATATPSRRSPRPATACHAADIRPRSAAELGAAAAAARSAAARRRRVGALRARAVRPTRSDGVVAARRDDGLDRRRARAGPGACRRGRAAGVRATLARRPRTGTCKLAGAARPVDLGGSPRRPGPA